MQPPRPTNTFPWRAWLCAVVVVAIALVASETLLVLGVMQPVLIEGCSMAPAALGPHYQTSCPHCEWQFAVAANQFPSGRPLSCPDCQQEFLAPSDGLNLRRGERVLVNRLQLVLADPQRWDVVVFRCPQRADSYCIKRVLGLPGEHVDFASGDLLINDRVVRKSIDQQIKVRQLVHRERDHWRQWRGADRTWQWRDGCWRHQGNNASLEFDASGGAGIDDWLGVNQTAPISVHPVRDLMVSCKATLATGASVRWVANFADGQAYASPVITASAARIVWSLFDRQAQLAIDGEQVFTKLHPTAWPEQPRLSIEASGQVTLSELCVWRDAYYHTRATDLWPVEGVRLAENGFFVVGDNVAISEDSRTWPTRGVDRSLLTGVPLGLD